MKLSKKLSSISISIAAISTFASVNSLQADEYKKGIYSNIGVGAGTYSDILWTTGAITPFDYGISLDFEKRILQNVLLYISEKLYNAVAVALAYVYRLDRGEDVSEPEIDVPEDLRFNENGQNLMEN